MQGFQQGGDNKKSPLPPGVRCCTRQNRVTRGNSGRHIDMSILGAPGKTAGCEFGCGGGKNHRTKKLPVAQKPSCCTWKTLPGAARSFRGTSPRCARRPSLSRGEPRSCPVAPRISHTLLCSKLSKELCHTPIRVGGCEPVSLKLAPIFSAREKVGLRVLQK